MKNCRSDGKCKLLSTFNFLNNKLQVLRLYFHANYISVMLAEIIQRMITKVF